MSASTLDRQAASLPHPPGADRGDAAPAAQPRQRRRHLVLSATLALAALGVGATAGGVLATGTADPAPVAATSSAPTAAAPAPPASAAPGPAAGAPPVPAAPAGSVAVTTAAGAPLPASTAAGARTLDDALSRGDAAGVRATYAPTASGAPWAAVEQVVTDPRDRAGLLAALRTPPQARDDVPYLYVRDGYRLGLDDAGRLRFVRAP